MVLLCFKHGLFDAMIYIYNFGLNDYITPLKELVQLLAASVRSRSLTVVGAGDLSAKMTPKEQALGNKLLVYISCCLTGRAFPRGDIPT
jgi:hypothetical protein